MKQYLGDYVRIGDVSSDSDMSILIENGQLVRLYQSGRQTEFYWHHANYFYGFPGINRFYKNEKGQHFFESSDGRRNQTWIKKRDVDLQ